MSSTDDWGVFGEPPDQEPRCVRCERYGRSHGVFIDGEWVCASCREFYVAQPTIGYIVGIDLSTRRLDAALIPLHPDHDHTATIRLASDTIHGSPTMPAMRIVDAHRAAHRILTTLRNAAEPGEIKIIAVETPTAAGMPSILASLSPIYGAVCSAADPLELVVGIRATEWRDRLNLKLKAPAFVTAGLERSAAAKERTRWLKQQSVTAATQHLEACGSPLLPDTHDAAEALLIAIAGRALYAPEIIG